MGGWSEWLGGAAMRSQTTELLKDVGLLVLVFVNWTVTCAVTDAVTDSIATRRACAAYTAAFASLINAWSVANSWMYLGSGNAPRETIRGVFCEICNLTQAWGALFAAARYFSLPEDNPFFANSLMHAQSESLFEMSLVQSGTGWAATVPTTALERIVAWATAYIGGVLCTNMFLLSVVLSRRGYWEKAAPATRAPAVGASTAEYVQMQRLGWGVTLRG